MPRKTCDQQTYSSVAHTQMALRMLDDGKAIQMTENLATDITAYKLSQHLGDESIFAGYVVGNYDSSGDYWKLISRSDGSHVLEAEYDKNGKLITDLTIAYYAEGQNGEWELVGEDFHKNLTGSAAGSIVQFLGRDRATELLGSHLGNADLYDKQTLMDVLDITDMEASKIQRSGKLPDDVTELQLTKLAGEALLKKNGFSYTPETSWKGGTMDGLVGGLASTAVSFGMSGNATFNLAGIKGVGLLEVTLGKDGISGRFGSGGMSLSAETLAAASRGRSEAGKVVDWKYGGDESRSTLNGVNQLGHTDLEMNHRLANDIWSEEVGINYGYTGGFGLYKVGDDSMTLDISLLGDGIEGSARLATVLAHEGTHLYGNRVEGVAHLQSAATYMQLLDKFNLAGDQAFAGEIMAGLTNPNSWVENTGDEDWWKQVRRNNGSFAWQEDGSLDFSFEDGTVVTAEEMKGFISSYLIKQQAQNQGIGVFSSYGTEPTNAEIAMTGVFADYLRNSSAIFPQQVVDKYAAFIIGTEAFVDASIAVQNAMTSIDNKEKGVKGYSDQKVTESLSEMFYKLEKVQESGFLEKNKIQISDNLVGHGIDTNPYLPLTGSISVTSLQGYRFVTQDFYDGLKDNSKANFPLNNFAKNKHIHTDLWSLDKSVVTSVDGSIKLNYDSTWGLNGAQFSNNSMRVYLSNHLDSNSLMNYLSVFGMDGTRISQLQNGQYSLEGVKAGVMYATMGQTGISGGAHIDFGIYEVNNKNILSMYRDNNLNFESVYSNVYEKLNMEYDVKAYSGLSSKRWDIDERAKEVRVYMHDVLINSWNDTYKPILEVLQFLN